MRKVSSRGDSPGQATTGSEALSVRSNCLIYFSLIVVVLPFVPSGVVDEQVGDCFTAGPTGSRVDSG